jgi:ribonuclease D
VWSIVDIASESRCREAIAACRNASLIAIDTETYDWLPDGGRGPSPETVGRLGLLQLGIPAQKTALIVDIVELERQAIEWKPFVAPLLSDNFPPKIVHFAPFERAVFERCGLEFGAGVIDTLALARSVWGDLQREYPELKSKSLKSLAYHLLGKDISKAEQGSDWRARPLTPEQRDYAALDVEIAADLYRALERFTGKAGIDPLTVDWRSPTSAPKK